MDGNTLILLVIAVWGLVAVIALLLGKTRVTPLNIDETKNPMLDSNNPASPLYPLNDLNKNS